MIPLLDEAFPSNIAKTTVVRIIVGISTSEETQDKDSLQGNIPGIQLFDVAGRLISDMEGSSKNKIADGSQEDIKLPASDDLGGRQAQYISAISGGNDGICISYITVTWPDGLKESWMGDWGYLCSGPWYPAHTISNVQDDYTPKCTWIDSDSSNGIGIKGLGTHITDFTPTKARLDAYQNNTSSFVIANSTFRCTVISIWIHFYHASNLLSNSDKSLSLTLIGHWSQVLTVANQIATPHPQFLLQYWGNEESKTVPVHHGYPIVCHIVRDELQLVQR